MCGVGHRTISILLVSVFVKNFEIENGRTEKHRNHPLSVPVFVTPFDIKVGLFVNRSLILHYPCDVLLPMGLFEGIKLPPQKICRGSS